MSKRMNKIALIGLCGLLAILMVAGCSGKEAAPSTAPGSAAPGSSAPASDAQKPPLDLKLMIHESAAQPMVVDSPSIKERERQNNVKLNIEVVPDSNYTEKSRVMIATNSIPDILWLNNNDEVADYANTGIFLPISDYLDYAPNFKKILDNLPDIKNLYIDGKLYGFPVLGHWVVNNGNAPMIRMDVLQELGLEVPKTFEELYTTLKAFKTAYPNSYPVTFRGTSPNRTIGYLAFYFGSGYSIYYEPEQSKYLYGPAHADDFLPVLEYMNRLFKDKLLDPDYAVNTGQAWEEKLSSGKSMFYIDNNSFALNFTKALQLENPNAKFEQINLFENQKGQTRGIQYPPNWWNMFVINSQTKHPEEVVKFLDWHYSEEGILTSNFGIEGEHYRMENGEPVMIPEALDPYRDSHDPFRSMASAIGLGLASFNLYIDQRAQITIQEPEKTKWGEMFTPENGYHVIPLTPPFTQEENDKLTNLMVKLDNLLIQEMDKFIMGTRPLSEYGQFAEQLQKAGAGEVEDIYNAARARVEALK